jgi:hypothetical protein
MRTVGTSSLHERLAVSRARLERLDQERIRSGNPFLDKDIEHRIVWSELLELELQEIDEQVDRICRATAQLSGPRDIPPAQRKSGPKQASHAEFRYRNLI